MKSGRMTRWFRRFCQVLFFLLFIWLLLSTFYHGIIGDVEKATDTLSRPVSVFLQIDPLAAVTSLLAAGTLYENLGWSLIVIVLTIFLGRVFCGWACPMGTLCHAVSEISPSRPARKRIDGNKTGKHQSIKYGLLVFFLAAALFGSLQAGLLDPICLVVRSLGLSLLPILDSAARGTIDLLSGDGDFGKESHLFLDRYFLGPLEPRFLGGWLIGIFFILLLFLNRRMTRFFCRVLCPLGALLGIFSRFSILDLGKEVSKCDDCGLCTKTCQGAASPEGGVPWKTAECVVCFNCTAECPRGALSFRLGPEPVPRPEPVLRPEPGTSLTVERDNRDAGIPLTRRGFVAAALAGAVWTPLARSSIGPPEDPAPLLIRPPGSCDEKEFLERCIKCGQCMKVCPNNAVHPASFQGGLEGIWTPVIIPRIGYCEPTCTLCSQVCPTGAIRSFTAEDKTNYRVNIGTAVVDRSLCLPWDQGKPCLVCEEFCPVSPKAIWFEKKEVLRTDGSFAEMNLPRVEPDRCTGCGGCETVCPVPGRAAIRLASYGESRSSRNRVIL